MASVRNLKKDINFVLGDIIEAVYLWELANTGKPTKESEAVVDEAIVTFDNLMKKINQKGVEDKKEHFRQINKELEEAATQLVGKINQLA
ncbi:hypothetical protein CHU92_00900 [Flavobacterium cyanobacteriorum]|uniref:Uncharacterized protein n=1 Tax=Flavobacterium cyanobacteriorum TaxID=2022802 RepID=A0A256A2U1_9FLAO|nr:hypothetical protein [Flavobacterium cyanobacteriorum]OYQ47949.1 hypothetical protein CHU92_00900 [Flavobacterium cyanobacteriorum]